MDSVVTGRVEDVLNGTQFADHFGVQPELVDQTQLVVHQIKRRRDEQSHRQVEYLGLHHGIINAIII